MHQTQGALKVLYSHTEIEATASIPRSIRMLQKDVIHYSLIKNFLPIYFQLKISNFRQDLKDY